MSCVLAFGLSPAAAAQNGGEPSNLIFITVAGVQSVFYGCQINLLRQWPSDVPGDDGMLAYGCEDPQVVPPSGSPRLSKAPRNVSDRQWSVTLTMSTGSDRVFSGCMLEGQAVSQGSSTMYFQCQAAAKR